MIQVSLVIISFFFQNRVWCLQDRPWAAGTGTQDRCEHSTPRRGTTELRASQS